jgi:predicted Zn-dependent protease
MATRLLLSMFFDVNGLFSGIVLNYGLLMPFSRNCESEADHIGLLLMSKACYDPNAAIEMWESMEKLKVGKQMEFISTHPSNGTIVNPKSCRDENI